jgi:heterodisulfide reductase subunit B2
MTSYAYYPGCSGHGTASDYDHSARLVADKLGLSLHDLADWTCCGATAAHSTSPDLATALPARNLQIAAQQSDPLITPCVMCYSRMKAAQHTLANQAQRRRFAEILGNEQDVSGVNVFSLLEVLASPDLESAVAQAIVRPLTGLRLVAYYGCLLTRPAEIMHPDDVENPQMMDHLLSRVGAEVVDWPFKTECCGGSLALGRPDIVLALSKKLIDMAIGVGAQAIVTACPMCHSNLDTRQGQIRAHYGGDYRLPILYFTEVIGLAMGLSPRDLHMNQHLVDATRVLA